MADKVDLGPSRTKDLNAYFKTPPPLIFIDYKYLDFPKQIICALPEAIRLLKQLKHAIAEANNYIEHNENKNANVSTTQVIPEVSKVLGQ